MTNNLDTELGGNLARTADLANTSRRVESSIFHTSLLPSEKRFGAWQESIGVMFEAALHPAIEGKSFNARVESVLLDGIMLSHVRSGATKFDRRTNRIVSDSIDHYMFQLFRRGSVEIELGSKLVEGRTGALVGFDLGAILDSANTDFDVLTVIIPRRRLEPHLRNPGSIHSLVLDPQQGSVRLFADYLSTLCEVGARMTEAEAIPASNALVLLLAAACNQVPADPEDPPDWADHSLLTIAKAEINARLSDSNLNADRLAGLLGLSRSRLYKLFEPQGGVMHIVREQRLRRALNDLVTPRGQRYHISEIAFRWGFTSPAQFARAFRGRFGCSPREARAEGRLAAMQRRREPLQGVGDRKYEAWIETLS